MIHPDMLALGTTRSCIRELFEYGLQQAAVVGKENVFDYSLGNPSIPSPKEVNEAICQIVEEQSSLDVHGYTSAPGYQGVRQAVASDLSQRFSMAIRPENLFFTCGAAPALIAVIKALCGEASSEIAAIAPYFPEYKPFVQYNGGRFVAVPADTKHFQIDFDALQACISVNTQAIIVNSPNNPSGAVYTAETIRRLAQLLTQKSQEFGHPIYIIADEPYRELVYGDVSVPFIPQYYPNTVVCYSYSKSLSLPGERIGYVLIPDCVENGPSLFAAVAGASRAMGHVCPPSLIQRVIAQCTGLRPDLEAYDRNRTLLYSKLTSYGYECCKPDGAFYLFIKAPGGDSQAFSRRAMQENLLLVPGDDFGCPEFFRICYCVSFETIIRSLPIFQKLIAQASRA